MAKQAITASELLAKLQAPARFVPSRLPGPHESLAWAMLAPAWPENIAVYGFPADLGLATGEQVVEMLTAYAEGDFVDAVESAPPCTGRIYQMDRRQRRRAMQELQSRPRTLSPSLFQEALRASNMFRTAAARLEAPVPQVCSSWCRLLEPAADGLDPDEAAVAARLLDFIQAALSAARKLGLEGSPEAAMWMDAAEPLAFAVGGPIRVASARAQRLLEIFHRRSRDEKLLSNYLDRDELNQAIEVLLAREPWAIHYIGFGGAGKTMFLRHLQSELASKLKVATARVDFDHLNPDYPLRSPGLLLLSFTEELKLDAPEDAVDWFRKLAVEVGGVHRTLEEAQQAGKDVPLGCDAPGFDFCLKLFGEALNAIERNGRRTVLILDTCEELARLRFDGKLPRSLSETFRILEYLHRACPSMRVVFSGRRPLAQSGVGWSWEGEELPPRADYLLLRPILGFTRQEALKMLADYRRREAGKETSVRPELYEGILQLSPAVQAESYARLSMPSLKLSEGVARFNPYDIALYAGWAASDESLTATKLSETGRHHYVRERIVGRLREDLQPWLPYLVVLGRFDEELLREVTGLGDGMDSLWTEIRRQEWTDMDRGVTVDRRTSAPMTFWNVDPQLCERLEAFYTDESPESWTRACRAAAAALEKITIEREDWGSLTPAYFAVCAGLLRDQPQRAAAWWQAVEKRILESQAWSWAEKITGTLLDRNGCIGPAGRTGEPVHPLDASIRALQANVQMRVSAESELVDSIWMDVEASAGSHPDPAGQRLLRFRAKAGLVAHLRYRADTLTEGYAHEFQGILERVPPLEQVLEGLDPNGMQARQAIHTEMALIENAVEVMERVQWSARPPRPLVELILRRAELFAGQRTSIGIFVQRLRLMLDGVWSDWLGQYGLHPSLPDEFRLPAFDWIPPGNPSTRWLLDCGRVIESGKVGRYAGDFFDIASQSVSTPHTLDEDRLLSQAFRLKGAAPFDPQRLAGLASSSIALAQLRKECQAHRRVPPLYVTAIQSLAFDGRIDAALNVLETLRSVGNEPSVKRWLDRAAMYLNERYLLTLQVPEGTSAPAFPHDVVPPGNTALFMEGVAGALQTGDRAAAICAEHGFRAPERARDLDQVPRGWQPWFARYLLIKTPRPEEDERAQLIAFLRKLYPQGLPTDIAFLGPVEAPTSQKPSSQVGYFFLGLSIFAGLGYLVFRGADWTLVKVSGHDLPWWQDLLALVLTGFAIGLVILAQRRIFPLVMRALSRGAKAESSVSIDNEERCVILTDFEFFNSGIAMKLSPVSGGFRQEKKYRGSSAALTSPTPLWPAWLERLALYCLRQARIEHNIVTAGNDLRESGPPWEALLGMVRGKLPRFSECPFLFRRTTSAAPTAESPFPRPMTMLSVSSTRELGTWNDHIRRTPNVSGFGASRLPAVSDPAVGVLFIQAQTVVSQGEVQFVAAQESAETFRPVDILHRFPAIRVVVLLGFDRNQAAGRTSTDRIAAGQERLGAYALARVGVPAVISIPGLPSRTKLVDEALEILASTIAARPKNAVRPLRLAVREIQERIFEKCGLPPEDATELAYDVCYYSAGIVNLQVKPSQDPQSTEQGASS